MGKCVGLIEDIGLRWSTTAQCASQFERFYCEWLRQDAAYVGESSGGINEGIEQGMHKKG